MSRNEKPVAKLDENLYSRQLYVLSKEAMAKITVTDVLIVGLSGVGVEIAKNTILAGVGSVVLYDNEPTEIKDLSSQFYLSEEDVGKPRGKACGDKLAELNNYVQVSVHSGELDEAFIKKFHVVVLVGRSMSEQLKINDICHANKIAFIATEARGVFGSVFTDYGDNFIVYDTNGEPAMSHMVASITSENPGVVTVVDDARLQFEDGDEVQFTEVQGMNLEGKHKIKLLGPYAFQIGDLTQAGKYVTGGYATQVKKPKVLNFKPLRESIADPGEFLLSDFAKFDYPNQLHVGFQALHAYWAKNGSLPAPHHKANADEVIALANDINNKAKDKATLNEDVIRKLAFGARGDFSPLAAVLGGIVAQEILKAASGKFHPIYQWFYFDAIEALPAEEGLKEDEFLPTGSRYDGQIITLGRTLQNQILDVSYFLVGAGAIGCEMLKNWAMMGLACGKGKIHVTDMDTIEKSNLNRQFLFRSTDLEKLKSATAAAAVKKMNSNINIESYSLRVGAETEKVFNEAFYKSLSGVCNALDNIEARMYMDSQCVFYKKSLLESGTLGTKANTQVVAPNLTESYGSSRDPPEKSIPQCTLHHFPNSIDHTLQWSRDLFEGLYKNSADNVNSYLTNPTFIESLKKQSPGARLEILQNVKSCLVTDKPANFWQCVLWARLKFEEMYNNNIQQLLYNFPKDMITSTGAAFWSGPKRAPTPLKFNESDPLHMDFITSTANLRAVNYGIAPTSDQAEIKKILHDVVIPEFSPKKVKIATTDAEVQAQAEKDKEEDDDTLYEKILSELPTPTTDPKLKMNPISFEKDDDSNYHMDFITAASNLRAANYSIAPADKHKSKGIAGKIIPAMVTTTALVTGLVCIELIKLLQNKKLDQYKNGFVNLALPLFAFSEPLAPPKKMITPEWGWTLWDRFDVQGDITLAEFLKYFQEKHQLEVTMISSGVSMLYNSYFAKSATAEKMPMKMTKLVEFVSKKPIPADKTDVVMEICCNRTTDDEEVDVPYVRYIFGNKST